MSLSIPQMALMSRLLDEALPLNTEDRRCWLAALAPEYQSLAGALREALLPAGADRGSAGLLEVGTGPVSNLERIGCDLQAGDAVGPYRLIRLIGEGGMAEVWLAQRADGAFKREVALKLPMLLRLRKDIASRFFRERDILAALEHPNIARLYDAGVSSNGLPYLAMEYVAGEPLTVWCDARRLGIRERLKLFLQVLDAVHYAHGQRVIHRDIKPTNILVTDARQVRLLDFGVAKLLAEEEQADITQRFGMALTPNYASPEQLRGEPIGTATDVYALGVVLYELLCGSTPYQLRAGVSLTMLQQALSTAEVKPPGTQVRRDASLARGATEHQLARQLRGDLSAIVLKALAKEPPHRYDSASSMAADLQRYLQGEPIKARKAAFLYRARKSLGRNRATILLAAMSVILVAVGVDHLLPRAVDPAPPAAFTPPAHSVAVVPFINLSGDPKEEYFSDGVSEELINALTHVEALQVSARTSSFSFKGKDLDIGTIARKLNVAAILEGSIRRDGNTVRITAQLINTVNGFQIWSQSYDRDLKDILALQTGIATTVAQEMQIKLLGDETVKMEVGGTRNPQAYDAYLRGMQIEVTGQDIAAARRALAAFDQALALDPDFAAAHAQRAHALRGVAIFSTEPAAMRELYAQAREAAERAIALAPDYADAHMVLGWHILANGFLDFGNAAREIDRAMALAPGSAAVLDGYAGFQGIIGHQVVALAAMRHAITLDPQNPRYREHLLANLSWARRFEDVLVAVMDAQALHEEGNYAAFYSATSNLKLGHPEHARQICESPATPLAPDDRHFCLALADHALGKIAQAINELDELKALRGDLGAASYAAVYAQWGDPAAALRWLATAESVYRASLMRLKVDWMFDPIRSQPQFQTLEQRLNFPP
jgi:serine/threonine protein kinase